MNWFESLTGFREVSPHQVRENISVDRTEMTSRVNGKVFACGILETPSLSELRELVNLGNNASGKLLIREEVEDVRNLHAQTNHAGALFQVASQFNLLEMASPQVTPESGVGKYEYDDTQGPACAVSAGAGTIYRNYFVKVNGRTGQTADNQIDCLADLGNALGNGANTLWKMTNGYALATQVGLNEISKRLRASSEGELDDLRKLLRIGIQWNTQVTIQNSNHLVSQAYCSALPVAYYENDVTLCEPFARLVLESAYEATICAAILNSRTNGNNKLFLTLLGGGVFANPTPWIIDAMQRALFLYQRAELEVAVVNYRGSNKFVQQLKDRLSK